MNVKAHVLNTLKLAIPVSLGQLGHIFTQVADSVMLGNYHPLHLAASTLGFNLLVPFMLFGIGFSMSLTPTTAQALGQGNALRMAYYLKNAFGLFTVIGVAIVGLLFLLKPIIYQLDQDPEIIPLAESYYQIVSLSIGFVVLFQVFRQFSEGLSETKIPMYISIIGNGLNILGNYALIYGAFGLPEMGLYGAALSTLISRFLMVIMGFVLLYFHPKYKEHTRLALSLSFKKLYLYKLMHLGFPIAIQYIIEVTAFAIVVIFIGWMGKTELVAHNIAMNLATIAFIIGTGIGAATTVRTGFFFGKKDINEMRKAGRAGFILSTTWFTLTAFLLILGKNYLPTLYVDDTEVQIITSAAAVILIAGLFQFSDGIQMLSLSILRGMNDVKIPATLSFVAYWVIGIPSGYLLAFNFNLGLEGIWYGLILGLTCSAILLIFRLRNRFTQLETHG